MKKLLLIFGLLLFTVLSFAQIDIYGVPPNGMPPNGMPPNGMPPNGMPPNGVSPNRSHPSFIKSVNFNKTQPIFRDNLLIMQNKPLISQYLPKKRDCYYLLVSQTSICFNREVNLDAMSRQTKHLFFKMKMWKYFH